MKLLISCAIGLTKLVLLVIVVCFGSSSWNGAEVPTRDELRWGHKRTPTWM